MPNAGTFHRRTGAAVLACTLAVLAGCSGSTSEGGDVQSANDVPSLSSIPASSDQASDGTDDPDAVNDEDAVLAWAACMRGEGVDVPDPTVDENGQLGFPQGNDIDITSPEFAAANETCGAELANVDVGISDEQITEVKDAFLRFTECLRGEGLAVGDFQFGNGNARRVVLGEQGSELIDLVAPAVDGLDPDNPAHQAAVNSCEPELSAGVSAIPGIGEP